MPSFRKTRSCMLGGGADCGVTRMGGVMLLEPAGQTSLGAVGAGASAVANRSTWEIGF